MSEFAFRCLPEQPVRELSRIGSWGFLGQRPAWSALVSLILLSAVIPSQLMLRNHSSPSQLLLELASSITSQHRTENMSLPAGFSAREMPCTIARVRLYCVLSSGSVE
jgi:hypothetical protein